MREGQQNKQLSKLCKIGNVGDLQKRLGRTENGTSNSIHFTTKLTAEQQIKSAADFANGIKEMYDIKV